MASKFLSNAVSSGSVVIRTELKDSKGKYGRVLGTVEVDGVDINQAMCDKFLAVPYFGQNKAAVEAAHLSNRTKLIELGQFDPTTVSS